MNTRDILAENRILRAKVKQLENELRYDSLTSTRSQRDFISLTKGFTNDTVLIYAFDLKNFGEYNIKYGHHEGDKYLQDFAARLSDIFRCNDVIYRRGGDEFVVVLPETNKTPNFHRRFIKKDIYRIAHTACITGAGDLSLLIKQAFKKIEDGKK